jgi:DNA modification methylase
MAYTVRMKPYIQPFERLIALEELATVAGSETAPEADDSSGEKFVVKGGADPFLAVDRLAYWERIEADGRSHATKQALLESTATVARNGRSTRDLLTLRVDETASLPRRRMLRYGPHGIHEYRGKFFPQLVRAFVNAAGVKQGGIVADPMVGSGTTPVEAAALGVNALALDINPLSVFVATAKCRLLGADPESLVDGLEAASFALAVVEPGPLHYLERLDPRDQLYLRAWLPGQSLAALDVIASYIGGLKDSPFRDLMRVSLSNIIRRVSFQKDDDLRVRRDLASASDAPVTDLYLDELRRSVRSVVAYLSQRRGEAVGSYVVKEGDARELGREWAAYAGTIDLVVTSPPYATALPYLDTDRLSLCYLDLLSRPDHRRRDAVMIGNREITDAQRGRLLEDYERRRDTLPPEVTGLVDRIRRLNDGAPTGFRRRNAASLLGKYFTDMREVLAGINLALRPNALAFVVVGSNHTIAGGERVEIPTAALIGELSKSIGFRFERLIPMEMLVSRDIFRRNASSAESIVVLRRLGCDYA